MLTEETQQKCIQLDENDKEFRKYNNPAKILGLICGLTLLTAILWSSHEKGTTFSTLDYILLAISAVFFGPAKYLSIKAKPYKIDGKALVALRFYRAYRSLENYQKTRIKSRLDNAKRELNSALGIMSNGWSKLKEENVVFKELAAPINDFIENIKERFVPFITNTDDVSLDRNLITSENLVGLFLQKEQFDFSKTTVLFDTYPTIEKNVPVGETIRKNRKVKTGLLWAAFVAVGGIVTLISHLAGGNDQTLIMVWVTVSTAAVTIYYTAIRRTANRN